VRSVLLLTIAAIATCLWSITDRRRTNYSKLHEWFRVYVSVALGTTMLWYAIVKFYHGQFRPPGFALLMTPVGQFTPMELLWTFMGYSYPYTVFTGIVEAIGASLLFIRRLTTIGAMVCCAALTQVFILDVSYGVHLKVAAANLIERDCLRPSPEAKNLPITAAHLQPAYVRVLALDSCPPALWTIDNAVVVEQIRRCARDASSRKVSRTGHNHPVGLRQLASPQRGVG
jgi:hypothetical protein